MCTVASRGLLCSSFCSRKLNHDKLRSICTDLNMIFLTDNSHLKRRDRNSDLERVCLEFVQKCKHRKSKNEKSILSKGDGRTDPCVYDFKVTGNCVSIVYILLIL